MPKYMDRGLVKWGAFDALNGYSSMLAELRHRLSKREKPMLSEDALEELNYHLQEAYQNRCEVEVKYFADGFFRHTYGIIEGIDFQKRRILLSTKESLQAEMILAITHL